MSETRPQLSEARSSVGARRSEATEAAVLEAFAALLAEVGYPAITMEAVARRARAGKATVYRWWPTKAHIALSLISKAKIEIPAPRGLSLREDLIDYMTRVVGLWRGDAGLPVGLLVRHCYAEAWSDPELAAALQAERRERWTMLNAIIEAAVGRGELPPGTDLARAKDFVMSWPFYLLMTDRLPAPDEIARMVDDTLDGLRAGSSRRPSPGI
ncbi:TetR/AcrR family transcriptional regulator [Tabrizicola soli]|uniref:TetR/AcrR family transcriptional regulator n=1 Tax=Tabrizicola soli TaxID=2185115 RepID=A0ABV7DQK6_9RHOB|nr:TetR/AcrR family transcriptional regulator [Tabrizicola soli]